jgi:alpha-tubulin suppressor-like RCC1 family protein
VQCWGVGVLGELGNGTVTNSAVPTTVSGLATGATAISAGAIGACALKTDGSAWCWGAGVDGALGDGTAALADAGGGVGGNLITLAPVRVTGLSGAATAISSGWAPCAVTTTRTVECWGFTAEIAETPTPVAFAGSGAQSLSLGGVYDYDAFACAIGSNIGNTTTLGPFGIECWGGNVDGQLGNNSRLSTNTAVPVQDRSLQTAPSAIAASHAGNFACAIASGVVKCWGDNSAGQLGDGTNSRRLTPVAVQNLPSGDAVGIAAGGMSTCALMDSGTVYCWGDNSVGQLGNNSTHTSLSPGDPVVDLSGVTSITAGYDWFCALVNDGSVWCWGDNLYGTLGTGSPELQSSSPVEVVELVDATTVSAGFASTCATTASGPLWCWGFGGYGQLGNQGSSSSPVPVQVLYMSGASKVAVGVESACAILDGAAFCWGAEAIGRAGTGGDGEEILTNIEVPVTGLGAGVSDIAVGDNAACAIVNDGGVECWGANTAGQLGNGGAVNQFLPMPVTGFL